jgi:uncharacterized protein
VTSATPDPLAALISALSRPGAYPEEAWGGELAEQRQVELIHTHISVVFLTKERAYKLKKPLRLWGLLDYGSAERRLHWCREEVRLNRRLAPDLYLGVAPVLWLDSGELAIGALGEELEGGEHVVVMHRFAATATLAARLAAGRVSDGELQALGEHIARFHDHFPLAAELAKDADRRFAAVLRNNVRATRRLLPQLFPAAVHGLLVSALARALRHSRILLRQRLAAGQAVDGHGDLRLEHVLLEPELAVVDGVEFNADLRQVDRASDLAFLLMDLQAAGHGDRSGALLAGYGAVIEPAVLQLFCAYRAHVRAKVETVTWAEHDRAAAERLAAERGARGYLSLALAYARTGLQPPPLILLRGLSGCGKSHLAAQLAPWLIAEAISSDRVRKALFGLDPLARSTGDQRERLYSAEAHARTETALLEQAATRLKAGRAVLLDATHLRLASRQRAAALAQELGVPWCIVDLETPPELIATRLQTRLQRNDDPSDADLAVAALQRAQVEPLTPLEQRHTLRFRAGDDPTTLLMPLWERIVCGGTDGTTDTGPAPASDQGRD